jgi:hypothetical protein
VFRFERESLDEIDVTEGSTVDSINVRDKVCATPASFSGVFGGSEGPAAVQRAQRCGWVPAVTASVAGWPRDVQCPAVCQCSGRLVSGALCVLWTWRRFRRPQRVAPLEAGPEPAVAVR